MSKIKKPCAQRFLTFFLIWRLKEKPMYGYSLVKELREMALSPSKISSVYAILSRLEKDGVIKGRREMSGARMRKVYQTTEKGWKIFMEIKKRRVKGLLLEFVKSLVE